MRAAVEEKEIVCNHCGGVRLVLDPEIDMSRFRKKILKRVTRSAHGMIMMLMSVWTAENRFMS